jgi:tetratricopeptide (TPR) repeat protein
LLISSTTNDAQARHPFDGEIIGVAILVLAFNFIMEKRFGLSPIQKEARGLASNADSYLMQNDLANAKAEYEKAVAVDPTMGDAQAQLAVLYEMDGQTEKAKAAFAAAEAAFQDRISYLLTVARAYQMVGKADVALARCEEALAINPESAQALLTRGGVYEDMKENAKAIEDYQRSAELASAQGEDALYVLAKTRMGMLMQRGPGSALPGVSN